VAVAVAAGPLWADYADEALLDLRFSDLGLTSPGPFLEQSLAKVTQELSARGLRLQPRTWLSDEWFSPDGVAGMAMPFYLAHPRLTRLERRFMNGAEGGSRRECLQLLRHEMAHAFQHAYRFDRRRRWRELFGRSSTPYPTRYQPDPGSRAFVHHLRDWYAQCHPDEDFAETFAVWLQPGSRWRRRYAGWPALVKLEYVDQLMTELSTIPVPKGSRRIIDPLHRLTTSLREHYRERRSRFGMDRPAKMDAPLLQILGRVRAGRPSHRAAPLLRRIRRGVRQSFEPGSAVAAYALEMTYEDLIGRSLTLGLRTTRSEQAVTRAVQAFLNRYLPALLNDPSTWEWIPV